MSAGAFFDLQSAFVETMGKPVVLDGCEIVQGDWLPLDGPAVIEVRLLSETVRPHDHVRLGFKKKGRISLSDGSWVKTIEIRDQEKLPRWVRHKLEPKGEALLVYNAYTVVRGSAEFTESWTGNAGMIVREKSLYHRRYECSNGRGEFNKNDLSFEVTLLPAETAWLPEEIY